MVTKKYTRTFNFDLSIKALKRHYPSRNFLKAYSDIKKFLLKHNFEHRQWSGYKSLEPLSDREVYNIVYDMTTTFPWLKHCVNRFDVANIGDIYDLAQPIKNVLEFNEASQKQFSLNNLTAPNSSIHKEECKITFAERLAQAKEQAEEINKSKNKIAHKYNNIEL